MTEFFINTKIKGGSRYDMSKFMSYTDTFDPITSYFINEIPKLKSTGVYEIQGEEGRPDLLAYRIYNNVNYWWVLCHYNKKFTFDDFKNGDTISYPSIPDLESVYFKLKAKGLSKQ